MKRVLKIAAIGIVGLAILVGAAAWGLHWYRVGRFIEETDNAYVQAKTIAIRSELTARIRAVHVIDHEVVEAGDRLVTLDASDYRARAAQARSRVKVARSALTNARERIELQQTRIDEAQADINAAEAEVERARLELARARELAEQKYVSEQRLQDTEANYEVAQAQLRAARAALASQKQQLEVLHAEADSAAAQISEAEANLAYARNQLAKTEIRAPHDGVVDDVAVEPGTMAMPAGTLMYLVPIPQVYVIANFKETQIARMAIGQPVDIHVDAYPDEVFHGRVESLSPASAAEFSLLPRDNATGNFTKIVQRVPVKIRITEPPERLVLLKPGLSVVPAVDTREPGRGYAYRQQPRPGTVPTADARPAR